MEDLLLFCRFRFCLRSERFVSSTKGNSTTIGDTYHRHVRSIAGANLHCHWSSFGSILYIKFLSIVAGCDSTGTNRSGIEKGNAAKDASRYCHCKHTLPLPSKMRFDTTSNTLTYTQSTQVFAYPHLHALSHTLAAATAAAAIVASKLGLSNHLRHCHPRFPPLSSDGNEIIITTVTFMSMN